MRIAITRADAATLLTRALRLSAGQRGVSIEHIEIADRPWASATFEGVRHEVRLALAGIAARDWLAVLPEAQLSMRGHIVADVSVDAIDNEGDIVAATLTALTLAEH